MQESGYNGWRNYPTWCVNLWLGNEEGLYNEARELVSAPIDLLGTESSYVFVDDKARRRRLVAADRLKHWVREDLAPDLGASFAADLLGYALDEVDWLEIAEAWLEDVDELDEDEAARILARDGYEAGAAAGSWVIDGNTPDETCARILRGLEDGDPEVIDSLPSSPLSGEWAGDSTPRDILAAVDVDEEDERAEDLLRAYEDAYSVGVSREVEFACLYRLGRIEEIRDAAVRIRTAAEQYAKEES